MGKLKQKYDSYKIMHETINVSTKSDFNDAVMSQYGTICITGDLLDEIKAEFRKQKFGAIGKSILAGSVLFLMFAPICFPVVCAGLSGISISIEARKVAKAYRRYRVRVDMNPNDDELVLIHRVLRDEVYRDKWKGVEYGSANTVDEIVDMIVCGVLEIRCSEEVAQQFVDGCNVRNNVIKKIATKKLTLDHFKHNGYKGIKQPDGYKFVKIR